MAGISLHTLRGDLFGGLTAGIVALPLALAFGVVSGAGAAAGLYGAIVLGFVAAILGGTRVQISGPTGPMTVVFASALAALGGSIEMAMAVVLVGGILQILFGLVKTGVLVRYIPYPVISGFMSGIGAIIIILQIAPLLGADPYASPLRALAGVGDSIAGLNLQALALGALTLLIVFLTPIRISRFVPSPLLALVAGTGLAVLLGMNVPMIGEIPTSLPELHIPQFSLADWSLIFTLGLTLALLGSIDSLLTALVADSITQTRHKPNRELVGQGIGNVMCSFVGALPGAGATMRTVVNVNSGGTTRVSGVVHALFLLALVMGLAPLAAQIPLAVLAGILIKVGIDILDYRLLRLVRRVPQLETMIMAVVFFLTVLVDLVVAVGVGVVLAMGLLTWRVARESNIALDDGNGASSDLPTIRRGVRVVQVKGALFFGTTSQVLDRIEKVDAVMGTKVIVFDCRKAAYMDLTAIFTLDDLAAQLLARGVASRVVAKADVCKQLRQIDTPHLRDEVIYDNIERAVSANIDFDPIRLATASAN
ncbi:SulP family inorganic anion transporter [Methylonatrum kenyense]|uniref:SulP family inorganic anion transporter n=1 Tax=Methylonatrum kenyense TaxID=455253 RepID=UPI0020BFB0E5|nr:SulP family inorganic anion transporter [Methylonatrum kenyense]MCK8514907.1 SulP family inorganic anion transporter [Methylonatrum kenyense]